MKLAIVGATGLVGQEMIKVLEERRDFPVTLLIPVASARSVGRTVGFRGGNWPICTMVEAMALRPQLALFSSGSTISKEYAPQFAQMGCTVIDNSSAWRADKPLIVPEINADTIPFGEKIIANPNCSTIQLVMALKPLHERWGLDRVVVSTYQSVTGTGAYALRQYNAEMRNQKVADPAYPHPIFQNCLPHCDDFQPNGYTKEEMKLITETRKIMELPELKITATAVRVPVMGGHSESVNVRFKEDFDLNEVRRILSETPGVELVDEPENNLYPMPLTAKGKDQVFIGRLRRDESEPHTLNLWIVADNLRKGAATNAVQIAEYLLHEKLL